jgi:hypothetical protein
MNLHISFRLGQRLRAIIMGLVYRRSLSLRAFQRVEKSGGGGGGEEDRQEVGKGYILNLMTNDAQKLYEVLPLAQLL